VLIGPKIVSSAESFVLMMQQGAKAKLIGDATGGSSGRPMPHPLGNGVTVYLSSWEDELPDGTLLQGNGVHPDISVATLPRFLEQSDAVLEAALNHLRHQDTAANAPVGK
jgi:C-terminal processing protease CtpA/Prc